MANLLLIIAREYPERYEFLKKAFASRKEVEVVLDRRAGRTPPPNQDRRAHQTDAQLQTHGWVLVRRLPGSAKLTVPQAKTPAPQAKGAAPHAKPVALRVKPPATRAKRRAAKARSAARRSGPARRRRRARA
jgi:hypothetical protein